MKAGAGVAAFAALLLGSCATGGPKSVTPVAVDAGQAAALVSSFRAANGLGPVRVESHLMRAAAEQARRNGERDAMSHTAGGSLARRVSAAGYDWGATAENLGAGYASLDEAIDGWKASAGHRANLLNPMATEIGIAEVSLPKGARHRTYWVLVLAAPRPPASAAGPYAMTLAPVQ